MILASAFGTNALAASLFRGGSEATFVTSNVEVLGFDFGGDSRPRDASAGTTMMSPNGWRASLFVSHVAIQPAASDDSFRLRPSTFVSGRLSRVVAKDTRLSFDVFNLFNQSAGPVDYLATARAGVPASPENFLFAPGEPRGFRLNIRKTF